MKNFVADGDSIVAIAPYAVTPGLGMLIGALFCVATKTAASGASTDAVTEGQFDLIAVSAETATAGAVAYWDDTNRRVSVSSGTPIGTLPYGKTGGVATARVRLQSVAGAGSGGWVDPVYAWVNRGTPADNAGKVYRISDIGCPGAGTWWTSNGVRDMPMNGCAQLVSSCVPLIMPCNGTIGANGALSGLVAALDTIYNAAAGGCYMYFSTGQVFSGSAAGFYYVQMTSTTAGTIFNNLLTGGWPTAPASPTPIVAAGPGGYTGDAGADRAALSVTLPGGALGVAGRLRSRFTLRGTVTGAGNRTAKVFFGSFAYHVEGLTQTNNFAAHHAEMVNLGSASRQETTTYNDGSGFTGNVSGYSPVTASVDSTADQTVSLTLRNSAGTEWLILKTAEVTIGS